MRKGRIIFIYGPMFSGKTDEMMKRVRRLRYAGKKCLVLKHVIDDRYSKGPLLESHDGTTMPAQLVHGLDEVSGEDIDENDVICIDEGQFMPNLMSYVGEWINRGKDVIIAGLHINFKRELFPEAIPLLKRADKLIHLTAICKCGQKAPFTHRKGDSTELILIGGSEEYESLCGACFSLTNPDDELIQ